ncbi:hypothetical protein AAMO2058_001608500 [Amorphochlora amoebiformis]
MTSTHGNKKKEVKLGKGGSTGGLATGGVRHVVVFDFDFSLINANSDMWILRRLIPKRAEQVLAQRNEIQWTKLMHKAAGVMHKEGVTPEAMKKKFAEIPFYKEMREAVYRMADQGHKIYILSDANTVYIESILDAFEGLSKCFQHIYSNPAHFDSTGRLHIKPYHSSSHGCKTCPVNLCKSVVLREILAAEGVDLDSKDEKGPRVLYVGDGGNDVCPARVLRKVDVVAARAKYRLDKILTENPADAILSRWANGEEAVTVFREHKFLN